METLSRQQRRALERQKNENATYNFTFEQLEAAVDEMTQKRIKDIMAVNRLCNVAPALIALNNLHNFGNKRMTKWLDAVEDIMDSVNKGFVSINDLVEQCNVEFGIDLKERYGK